MRQLGHVRGSLVWASGAEAAARAHGGGQVAHQAHDVEEAMIEDGCTYPIIALQRWDSKSASASIEAYEHQDELSRWSSWHLEKPARKIFEIFDAAGRRRGLAGFEPLKPVVKWWDMSTRFGRGAWDVRVDLKVLPPLPLEAVKAKMIEIVDDDPLLWCDEELIAGEAGEPIDQEVLIARVHDRIKAVQSFAELPSVMDNAYYTFEDAEAEGLLKPRVR